MKKLIYLLVSLICISMVSAEYITYKDDAYWCQNRTSSETFIADCPADYRVPGNWFNYYHFTQNISEAYCSSEGKFMINCTYVITNWIHPNVVGGSSYVQISGGSSEQPTAVPEFTTIAAALALIGSGIIIYRKRK
jgi:hypothetical protein